jgi:hypothetical protein
MCKKKKQKQPKDVDTIRFCEIGYSLPDDESYMDDSIALLDKASEALTGVACAIHDGVATTADVEIIRYLVAHELLSINVNLNADESAKAYRRRYLHAHYAADHSDLNILHLEFDDQEPEGVLS